MASLDNPSNVAANSRSVTLGSAGSVAQPAAYMQVGGSAPGYRSGLQRAVIAQAAAVDPGCDDSKWEAVERFAFYDRAARAYAIVQTGEMQAWANLVFKKGVIAEPLRP